MSSKPTSIAALALLALATLAPGAAAHNGSTASNGGPPGDCTEFGLASCKAQPMLNGCGVELTAGTGGPFLGELPCLHGNPVDADRWSSDPAPGDRRPSRPDSRPLAGAITGVSTFSP